MTDIATNQAAPEAVPDEAAPPPEPWTPRRVAEWNAYYDVYVAAFVLALAFLGSCNRLSAANSGLWSLLQAGRQVAESGSPVGLGGGTLAGEGRRWVNIPWLYELVHYQVFRGLSNRGDQVAAGALIALDALVRAATAYCLLGLRRKGPGLWWAAICVALALGVAPTPAPVQSIGVGEKGEAVQVLSATIGVQRGGIAGVAGVAPETWGLLFLAVELLLIHQALGLGKAARLYGLIPLFALWANVDETFGVGLLVLAAAALGRALDARRDPAGVAPRAAFLTLAGSFAATFLNPSHAFGVLASFGVLLRAVGLPSGPPAIQGISTFGSELGRSFGQAFARSFQGYYAVLVLAGLASFALNRRRFSWARLLMFVVAAAAWALALLYVGVFAAVLALVLTLNGQEWYQDTFGTEGRLGAGWAAWSTGGRLATIAAVSLAIFQGTTGWGGQVGGAQFGLGYDPDEFAFESADAIAAAPIEGNVLNTTVAQGDALIWRTAGKRRPFIDSKAHLYPPEFVTRDGEFDKLKKAIRDDRVEDDPETKAIGWRPVLDRLKVSAVMLQTDTAPMTYAKLMASPNWVPFYDDGAVTMFGRADAGAIAADVAYYKSHRLDAAELAYKRPTPARDWVGPPRPVSAVDSVFQNRLLSRTQPHVAAAQHWLRPVTVPAGTNYLPDPAHCLLAIRELRTALSIKPDDYAAYRLLTEAYRLLLIQESALIAGIEPSPENLQRIMQAPAQPRALGVRNRQLLTALSFSIMTLPPSRTAEDRVERINLNYNLAQLLSQSGALDLARERVLAILDVKAPPGELGDEFLAGLTRYLGDLNQRVEAAQSQLNEMTAQRRASPPEKAAQAQAAGAPGLAIRELEEANDAGGGQGGVRATLVDLYCGTGQPEKANELIAAANLNVDDPTLSTGVGSAAHRQGMVYFLLGDYRNAASLWAERAIPPLQSQRLMQAPLAAQALLRGEPVASTRLYLELPEKINEQSGWEVELGMAALEGGLPTEVAAKHLRTALELEPDLTVRPVVAYYLTQLGESVPPPRATAKPAAPAATSAPTPEPTPAPTTPAATPEATPAPTATPPPEPKPAAEPSPPAQPPSGELPAKPVEPPAPAEPPKR